MSELILAIKAAFLGIVEGLTEFIPVSSTGHLLVAENLIDFDRDVFTVTCQVSAILAVCWVQRQRLFREAFGLIHSDPCRRREAWRFGLLILAAFLPSVVLGLLFYDLIKEALFNLWVIGPSLVLGGLVMLWLERHPVTPDCADIDKMSFRRALAVGFAQTISMFPGVSRAGATIVSGVWLRLDRRVATEFSFYLAIPTIMGASALDLWRQRDSFTREDVSLLLIGSITGFVTAMLVVRGLISYIGKRGLAPFGWYRILAGSLIIAVLLIKGAMT